MHVEVDVRQAIYALSDALDLVGVDDFYHGKRVAMMAVEVARVSGMDVALQEELFDIGLLHDCGVSSTAMHRHLVQELDWSGAQGHCERGSALLRAVPCLDYLADAVRYHHTHWADLQRLGLDAALARKTNLIFLLDRADALAEPHYGPDLLQHTQSIRDTLAGFGGSLFDPELVEAFLHASAADAFWLVLEPRHIQSFLGKMLQRPNRRRLNFTELRRMAMLISNLVDAKSPYTSTHSLGVAKLCRLLGDLDGQDAETCDRLELAGLMHDLGKLQVPDELLDKAGPLSETERQVVNRHSFETYQILRRIPGIEAVAVWAAYHHETLDGSGYPYGMATGVLPRQARIVAVADVFQAMAQDRPYRPALAPREILAVLQRRAQAGQLDAGVILLVAEHLDACWMAAIDPAPLTALPLSAVPMH